MSKSKTRFSNPEKWKPIASNHPTMMQDAQGTWVRIDDYQKLLLAYRGALVQLDRAAKLVSTLKCNR